MGPITSLFWTSGELCPGFQNQGGFDKILMSFSVLQRLWCCRKQLPVKYI